MTTSPEDVAFILARLPNSPEDYRQLVLKNLSRLLGLIELANGGYEFAPKSDAQIESAMTSLLDAIEEAEIRFDPAQRDASMKMLSEALPNDEGVRRFLAGLWP